MIIDEAQGLPSHTLEEIRLLLNLETARGKLLQVILSGQPEFEHKLRRAELRQIQQRVGIRCRTEMCIRDSLKDATLQRLTQTGMTVKIGFDVKPGGYIVRLVMRDSKAANLSARNGVIEIP